MKFFKVFSKLFQIVIHYLTPPPEWRFAAIIVSGIFIGAFFLILKISNATSYLSKDPQACINCHVMWPQYSSWQKSSHREVAKCVDCHIPHDNVIHSYLFKMQDGLRHSKIFTLRQEPQVIFIKEAGIEVVQQNCIHCHQSVLQDVSIHQTTYKNYTNGQGKLCWECHREVPHGRVHSLSSAPNSLVPNLNEIAPTWMHQFTDILKR